MPVVGAAEEDGVLAGVGDPVPQRQGGADPAGAAQDGEAAPAQPQAEEVGEAFAGVQPQVQADPQVAGAVAGQVAGGQERPGERTRPGRCRMARAMAYLSIIGGLRSGRRGRLCAGRCGRRRGSGRPGGPGAALIAATRSRGMEARGPFRSVTKERKRAVLVAFLGPWPAVRAAGPGARRPGATGHSARTQARNPARVEAGARARRSSHKIRPPRMASGVAASAASAVSRCWWRAGPRRGRRR